jgi:hypothetical protein
MAAVGGGCFMPNRRFCFIQASDNRASRLWRRMAGLFILWRMIRHVAWVLGFAFANYPMSAKGSTQRSRARVGRPFPVGYVVVNVHRIRLAQIWFEVATICSRLLNFVRLLFCHPLQSQV